MESRLSWRLPVVDANQLAIARTVPVSRTGRGIIVVFLYN